jgi:ketosteroid isomerase-like protein
VEGPRYDGRQAVMKVAADDVGEVYTVVLEKGDDGEWIIVAHSQMGAQQFQALPDQPKR